MKTGLTENTINRLQLGAGVFLKNYAKGTPIAASDIIGATRGGGTFSAVPTIRQVAVDGAPVYVKGLEVIDEWVITLSVANFIEFSDEAIAKAFGGGFVVEGGTTQEPDVTITANRTIESTDYDDVWWVGDSSDGKNLVIHLKNALSLGGFVVTFNDKGEGTFPATFTAHYAYDANNADWAEEAPFEIIKEN